MITRIAREKEMLSNMSALFTKTFLGHSAPRDGEGEGEGTDPDPAPPPPTQV